MRHSGRGGNDSWNGHRECNVKMNIQTDILLDAGGDVYAAGGDFAVGDSLNQRVGLLLMIGKGQLKQHPLTGVGIDDILLSESKAAVQNEIRQQLKLDGLRLKKIVTTGNTLHIDADY